MFQLEPAPGLETALPRKPAGRRSPSLAGKTPVVVCSYRAALSFYEPSPDARKYARVEGLILPLASVEEYLPLEGLDAPRPVYLFLPSSSNSFVKRIILEHCTRGDYTSRISMVVPQVKDIRVGVFLRITTLIPWLLLEE